MNLDWSGSSFILHPSSYRKGFSVRRWSLYATGLSLAVGLLCWAGWATAQRAGVPTSPTIIAESTPLRQSEPAHDQLPGGPVAKPMDLNPGRAPVGVGEGAKTAIDAHGPDTKEETSAPRIASSAEEARAREASPTTPAPAPEPKASLPAAALSMQKTGPSQLTAGKAFSYTITLHNVGAEVLPRVRIDDELPPGAALVSSDPPAQSMPDRLVWLLDRLDPGAERRITVEVRPGRDGEWQSTAVATLTASACLRAQVQSSGLTLAVKGPEAAYTGQTAPVQIYISNTAAAPFRQVSLRAAFSAGLRHPRFPDRQAIDTVIGPLAPGDVKDITLPLTVSKSGRQSCQFTVTAEGGLQTVAQAIVPVTEANLRVLHRPVPPATAGGEVACVLDVSNPGETTATLVEVTEVLPEGLDFVSAGEGGLYHAGTRCVVWPLGSLAPGQSVPLTLRLVARREGEWTCRSVGRAEKAVEVFDTMTVHVSQGPPLQLKVLNPEQTVHAGAETIYEIRIVNTADSAGKNLKLEAEVPAGAVVLDGTGPVAQRIDRNRITFQPLPFLAGRSEISYRIRVRAGTGELRLRASLTGDGMAQPLLGEERTTVTAGPSPSLTPVPAPLGAGGSINRGE
jgi:uncharacterized repeat protein (TIGR01451 family)